MSDFILELFGFRNIHRYTIRAVTEARKNYSDENNDNNETHDLVIEYIKKYPGILQINSLDDSRSLSLSHPLPHFG